MFSLFAARRHRKVEPSGQAPKHEAPADTQATRRNAEAADYKARQNAWAHPTPITTANLGNFVTAIHAEQAERTKGMSSA
ncbi:MAG: hypothetical protein ABI345_02615, partial [Jatrophihabitans sp.]